MNVPVTISGRVIGEAEISEDGEVITIELSSGALPQALREQFLLGLSDSLSIDTAMSVRKAPLTQEQKSQRWNQRNLPYGM